MAILQVKISGLSKCLVIINFMIRNMSRSVYTDHRLKKLKSCRPLQRLFENRCAHLPFRKESLTLHFLAIKCSAMSSTVRVPIFARFRKWLSLAVRMSMWNLLVTNLVEVHIPLGTFQSYYKLTSCLFLTQSPAFASVWSGRPWFLCLGSSCCRPGGQ